MTVAQHQFTVLDGPYSLYMNLQATLEDKSSSTTNCCNVMAPNSVPFSMTRHEVYLFYAMDRELYTILAILLFRDPVESMKVMAFWLWLETLGFPNVVKRIVTLPLILINELADETVTCLNAINGTLFSYLSQSHDIPLLQILMDKGVSIQFFYEHRITVANGIADVGRDVCVQALSDIMAHAIGRNTAYQNSIAANQSQVLPSPSNVRQQTPPAGRDEVVPPQERTMFVTFSKGYPVQEYEVIQFFTSVYGDCIESVKMQEVQPFEQALYARIVFYSANTVEAILSGMNKAKFTINGKHVWVRKFVARHTRPALAPAMTWP
ncbi:uncharacterized protein LOC126793999 [Argentina anserina]|uniref:uncharacterized protein LOC126793999 n=1 Tax=Argentina anserina TaxID=57926 RepID=UPI0021763152|nr:uncharacterized protein LOC126793999 [Potentilla anserina]